MKKKQTAKAVETKREGLLPGKDYLILTDLTIAAFTGDREDQALREDVIGGFHTLCADVGDIPGHPLSGWRAAYILPQSIWNAVHRPACEDPRGFVYDPTSDLWVSVYLAHGDRDLINMTYDEFVSYGQKHGCRFLTDEEFASAAAGSNEMTNIKDSCRPKSSGGHIDQLGRRMISNIGCEDCCGVLWQYISTPHPVRSEWALVAGGCWSYGAICGSRSRGTDGFPRSTDSHIGARFASEPLHKRVVR
jgi:hypothetical protein